MGCFTAPKTRSSPSLTSFLGPKQPTPIPTSDLKPSTPTFRARTLRSASRLVRNQPSALSAPSFSYSASPDHSLPHLGNVCGVTPSAPISAESCVSDNAMDGSSHLFPLPPPPSDDASSQSVSSVGSGCSTSSARFSSTGSGSSSIALSSKVASLPGSVGVGVGVVGNTIVSCPALEDPATDLHVFNQPFPLPPPPETCATVREFSPEEIAGACQNFAPEFWIREVDAGPVFKAIVKSVSEEEHPLEVSVTRVTRSRSLSLRKWRAEVSSLSRLSHPHLCRVVGFSAEDLSRPVDRSAGSWRERLLIYESTSNGSLETLLYGRVDKAPLDWAKRLKIALGAAQGLAFLHERSPRQILYSSFKTINIQVDKEFNAKLSDYGFAWSPRQLPIASPICASVVDDPYVAPETRLCHELSAKSNVWSFGIVLLELMTGRQNMDEMFPAEERNLAQWARPSLIDAKRLYLIMDPELKGRYATRSAKTWADIASQCLADDPVLRPCMREVVIALGGVSVTKRDPTSDMNASKARHYNLGTVLGSPARSFMSRASPYEPRRTRFVSFLSGEITKGSSKDSIMGYGPGPQSQYGFFSGEILQVPPSSIDKEYLPPPLGRSISSGATAVSG